MKTEIRFITKKEADELLRLNASNRPLSAAVVRSYEMRLRQGEWRCTHQGIAIGRSGRLLDGQHRLTAISNTGIAAQLMITTGMDEDVQVVLDTGRARTAGDMLGMTKARNATTIAAAINLAFLYQERPDRKWGNNSDLDRVSHSSILDKYNRSPDLWGCVSKIATSCRPVVAPGPFAALLWLATLKGYDLDTTLADFAHKLGTGLMLAAGDPILSFRHRFVYEKGSLRIFYTQQAKLANYIKLFNAHINGHQLKVFKNQDFPPMPEITTPRLK